MNRTFVKVVWVEKWPWFSLDICHFVLSCEQKQTKQRFLYLYNKIKVKINGADN